MQLAFTILVMALNLISSVNQSPNATPELKNQATQIATYAISYAQTIISQESSSSPVNIPMNIGGPLNVPKIEPVIQLDSTLQSSTTIITVTNPTIMEKTDSLIFTQQPIPTDLILIDGKYVYTGRKDGSYETNKYIYNVKESCVSDDGTPYLIGYASSSLKEGQTYTCTLTAESKEHWDGNWDSLLPGEVGTSTPYSFTVPLN